MTTSEVAEAPLDILLVDDKPENLLALEEILRKPDRRLFRATSGNEALRLLLKQDFALVLLDVQMPDMDGYETAQLMRSSERTRLVPIIFVTASNRSEERTFRGYEVGAVDVIYKPLDPHTLESKVSIFLDLHRKTRALERTSAVLRERVADLEYVSQTLSHDLRAPLRTIRAFSQVLADQAGATLDPQAADALSRIVRAASRMTAMVEDLYELLRLSADAVSTSEVDVAGVVREVTDSLKVDIEQAGATITHDQLPTVVTHRRLFSQILQNLIANAIKFRGSDPPSICIGAQREPTSWLLSVRDNGIGIAPHSRDQVFKLFSRLDASRGGSGVGLALCKRAVEKLGGRIWVGTDPGPGTTIYFTLPDRVPSRSA